LGPGAFSISIADVDDLDVVGHVDGPFNTTFFGDDVTEPYHPGIPADGARGIGSFFEPGPIFFNHFGVAAILIGVHVRHDQHIGPNFFVTKATRCLAFPDSDKGAAGFSRERVIGPFTISYLAAIIIDDALIALKIYFERPEQFDRF